MTDSSFKVWMILVWLVIGIQSFRISVLSNRVSELEGLLRKKINKQQREPSLERPSLEKPLEKSIRYIEASYD